MKGVVHLNKGTKAFVREYVIGKMKYVVTATVKSGAKEDAVAKVRRMIRNDIIECQKNTVTGSGHCGINNISRLSDCR
jgi:hypothetical protein